MIWLENNYGLIPSPDERYYIYRLEGKAWLNFKASIEPMKVKLALEVMAVDICEAIAKVVETLAENPVFNLRFAKGFDFRLLHYPAWKAKQEKISGLGWPSNKPYDTRLAGYVDEADWYDYNACIESLTLRIPHDFRDYISEYQGLVEPEVITSDESLENISLTRLHKSKYDAYVPGEEACTGIYLYEVQDLEGITEDIKIRHCQNYDADYNTVQPTLFFVAA